MSKNYTYWPSDSDNTIYISSDIKFNDMLDLIKEKWPNVSLEKINIETEYIHTDCIGYDVYDPMDYTTFIKIVNNE